MKLIESKTVLSMFLSLVVIITIFVSPLIGFDCALGQGGGQGGQSLGMGGLGGLGAGIMMGLPGFNMAGTGLGMPGLASSGMINPLGIGLPMGGSGSVGMLGAGPGMIGGNPMLGLGFGSPVSMFSSPLTMSGGFSPYFGQVMPIMGQGFMYSGMPPVTPFSNLYETPLPYGYNSYYAAAYTNELMKRIASSKGGSSGVPYFFALGGGGIITSPLPPWYIPTSPATSGPGILPVQVYGFVYDDEANDFLSGVVVGILKNNEIVYESEPTGIDGRYELELFADRYTLVYFKEGYQDQVKDIVVTAGMGPLDDIYMEKDGPPLNKDPVFIPDMLTLEVIAGETISLDPNAYVYDPDGDQLYFSYSGWNADIWESGSSYLTTEDDIGVKTVFITASDLETEVTQAFVIRVFPGYNMTLYVGFNLISYPFEDGDPNFSAFDLLEELGDSNQISSIEYYDSNSDQYISAWYDSNGEPQGTDFPVEIGQGYIVYADDDIERMVYNRYTGGYQSLNLNEGMNLIGIATYPEGYTSYDLLLDLGYDNVDIIYHYDPVWGDWESTYWLNGSPSGDVFPILMGEGYHIQMNVQSTLTLPRLRSFTF